MEGNMFKKVLVVGIIFLFIGVGIHPAFAVETKQSIINQPSAVEDCDVSKNSLEITEEVEKSEVNEKNDYDCLPCILKEKIEKTKGKNVLFNNINEHVESIIKKTSAYPPSHPICQMLSLLYGFCVMFGRIICAATIGFIYVLICEP